MKNRFAWALTFFAALLAVVALGVQGLSETEAAAGDSLAATYTHGILQVTPTTRLTPARDNSPSRC